MKIRSHVLRLEPLLSATLLSLALVAMPAKADGDGKYHGGENVYTKLCGYCHESGIGPVIKGRQLPPEYIQTIVRYGFRAMPAWPASYVDDQSLQAVAEFIHSSPSPKKQP